MASYIESESTGDQFNFKLILSGESVGQLGHPSPPGPKDHTNNIKARDFTGLLGPKEEELGVKVRDLQTQIHELQNIVRDFMTGDIPYIDEPLKVIDPDEVKAIIMREIEETKDLFPSDITMKYHIDYDLVTQCFDELETNGIIRGG